MTQVHLASALNVISKSDLNDQQKRAAFSIISFMVHEGSNRRHIDVTQYPKGCPERKEHGACMTLHRKLENYRFLIKEKKVVVQHDKNGNFEGPFVGEYQSFNIPFEELNRCLLFINNREIDGEL